MQCTGGMQIRSAAMHTFTMSTRTLLPRTSLNSSKWFQCSWTLQGLIAPRDIEFVDSRWNKIGNKTNMISTLTDITGIRQDVLTHGLPPPHHSHRPSVAQIMSWAASRQTRRVEDQAYSLIGLFGTPMVIQYGEKENAFQRLQEAIIVEYNDHTIFAWFDHVRRGSVLADSPSCFLGSCDVIRLDPSVAFAPKCPPDIAHLRSFQVTEKGIEIWLPVTRRPGSGNHVQAKLACCRKGNPNLLSINLSVALHDYDDLFIRDTDSDILSKKPVFPADDQTRLSLSNMYRDWTHLLAMHPTLSVPYSTEYPNGPRMWMAGLRYKKGVL
ncbi:hypothetical protein SCLCIDRAFT_1184296 [Scleroderma citrinum Foug A]|uniref:Heterokaryon incompatibility domain-containing protein n=1 Tax=Scleroderma citrinum Foug A TaxID=1036808 RepID=A0A0C3A491_9AGAM|nr:hypothetical protein SCLCIDRAFT_1184296 [Scleroderma citrinum Foug A]